MVPLFNGGYMPPSCLSLIGMPGSGKTTIGKLIAQRLGYAFVDTDLLIESLYGRRLQEVTDELPTEVFRDVEGRVICSFSAEDCVIATGGSAIYRPRAIRHLKSLGLLILLNPDYKVIEERVNLKPDRGISFGENQSLRDIYEERQPLYLQNTDLSCDSGIMAPEECVDWILAHLDARRKKQEDH